MPLRNTHFRDFEIYNRVEEDKILEAFSLLFDKKLVPNSRNPNKLMNESLADKLGKLCDQFLGQRYKNRMQFLLTDLEREMKHSIDKRNIRKLQDYREGKNQPEGDGPTRSLDESRWISQFS